MTQQIRSLIIALVVCVPALGSAGCDEQAAATGPSTVGGAPVVETFIGTVAVGSSAFYSFTVPVQGTVSLTLLTLTENGEASPAVVGLGIGAPAGIGCTAGVSVATAPGGTPQFAQTYPPGVYCAKVSDTGQLTSPGSFALNIAHPR